jgi:hypothetical protein
MVASQLQVTHGHFSAGATNQEETECMIAPLLE